MRHTVWVPVNSEEHTRGYRDHSRPPAGTSRTQAWFQASGGRNSVTAEDDVSETLSIDPLGGETVPDGPGDGL